MNKGPIQVKLHNADKVFSSADRAIVGANNSEEAKKLAQLKRVEMEQRQEDIDTYNFNICDQIDPYFKAIQISGKDIIVRLYKENYIKGIEEFADGVPMYDAWITQIDGRRKKTDPEKWVDNPLPYIFSGVVVAMSPGAIAAQQKEFEEIVALDPNTNFKKLEVGDIVQLEHFMFQDKRYYKNEQQRDFIKNPTDYNIEHWEGYVKIHPSMIKSKVLDRFQFAMASSPLKDYRRKKAMETK
jgi:hypothetical protein